MRAIDLVYMTRDFFRVVFGVDYFHKPLGKGRFFEDGRSYYVSFAHKAHWRRKYEEGVPVLYIPSLGRHRFFPGMILQYGLGSVDSYFATNDRRYLLNVSNVYQWIVNHIEESFPFDHLFQELDPTQPYCSNNSGMTQGEAISFLLRVLQCNLSETSRDTESLVKGIFGNMILPLYEGGTALYGSEEVAFCEYCRKDGYVVLNGWIFAIFGLFDYCSYFRDSRSEALLQRTLQTLAGVLPDYLLRNGWSYYDTERALCSPVYQVLHIRLIEALYLLTHQDAFKRTLVLLRKGDSLLNRMRYTLVKVLAKLQQSYAYTTER